MQNARPYDPSQPIDDSMKLFLTALCLLPLCACGGGGDARSTMTEATTALDSGDFAGAAAKYTAAMAKMTDADAAMKLEAELGLLQANAHLEPKKAKTDFLALVEREAVEYSSYNSMVSALAADGNFDEAIEVLKVGMEKLKEDEPKLKQLVQKVGDMAKNAGAAGALSELEGLGYVGN